MSVWDDMAKDAGYCGDEAQQVARMLEERDRELVFGPQCDYVGHDWADAGGGLEICMACEAERWSLDGDPARLPEPKPESQNRHP